VGAVAGWDRPESAYVLAGAGLYIVGTFIVTLIFNVPLNNRLAAIAPTDRGAPALWATYMDRWTMWNHIRTLAAAGALAAYILGFRQ
jgi:uncharacterized membrane protein